MFNSVAKTSLQNSFSTHWPGDPYNLPAAEILDRIWISRQHKRFMIVTPVCRGVYSNSGDVTLYGSLRVWQPSRGAIFLSDMLSRANITNQAVARFCSDPALQFRE